ncbi:MAG: cystathionine gamma-lyase [Proteobacteria bacterium]|nr:cystathionine gamma-lyase [Pseudomonadota bacterium]MBS0573968.1 cystathionine gamma-lyase [Pseudomonadota bacterium]
MDSEAQRRMAALLHHRAAHLAPGEPVALPIISSSTFHSPDGPDLSHVYGRTSMPTWEALEAQLALLEGAPCVAFPSGMAAISAALVAGLAAGKRLVLPADGYYVGRALAHQILARYGVEVQELPTAAYENADFTGAALVLVETPSNPHLDVCDLRRVADRAHAAGALVVADNTTMTPLLQRPLDLGADVVVAADTKAPAGHSDTLFGHVASRDTAFLNRVRDERRLTGAVPGSFEAWLVHRGLETLEVRLARMCATAQLIAGRLAAHPAVRNVRYPGLPNDPSHATARQQMTGFGFLVGFELPDAAAAERFLSTCPLIAETTSFGSTHTSGERRIRWGDAVPEGFIRLSVGIEPAEPLWAAIAAALAR